MTSAWSVAPAVSLPTKASEAWRFGRHWPPGDALRWAPMWAPTAVDLVTFGRTRTDESELKSEISRTRRGLRIRVRGFKSSWARHFFEPSFVGSKVYQAPTAIHFAGFPGKRVDGEASSRSATRCGTYRVEHHAERWSAGKAIEVSAGHAFAIA